MEQLILQQLHFYGTKLLSFLQSAIKLERSKQDSHASFQTSDGAHQHAFPYSNNVVSTIHRHSSVHPFFQERSNVLHTFPCSNKALLTFPQAGCCGRLQTTRRFRQSEFRRSTSAGFPLFQHSRFYFPPSARRMDSRQRIVSNPCKSIMSYIWQAGATTRDCCCGIQVICFRNSQNFHTIGIQVRIKA